MKGIISRQELRQELEDQIYNHIHNLADLTSDPLHRTVSDEQISKWNSGTGGGGGTVDPGQLVPIRLQTDEITLPVTNEGQRIFTFSLTDYIENKCFEFLIINSIMYTDFTITNNNTLTIEDTSGLSVGTDVRLVIVSVVGQGINGTPVANITKEQLSEELKAEIDAKLNSLNIADNLTTVEKGKTLDASQGKVLKDLIDTKAESIHNHSDYASTTHTHQDIIDQIPDLPTIATTIEAETGLDNTKMMTPVRVKEAIRALGGGGGTIVNNVFVSGINGNKFIATEITNTFTIPQFNTTKEILIMVHENVILNQDVEYSINKSTGVVTLSFQLQIGDGIFYKVVETSYRYEDLSGKPTIINDVTTGGITDILSAEQGKVLDDKIGVLNDDRGYLTPKIIATGSCDDLILNGLYYVKEILNKPSSLWGYLEVSGISGGYVSQVFTGLDFNVKYHRIKSGSKWENWKQIATTDKTEILFPYNSGYVDYDVNYSSIISKDSIGRVVINVYCKKTSGKFPVGVNQIAVLPPGFRPKKHIQVYSNNCDFIFYSTGIIAVSSLTELNYANVSVCFDGI